MSTTRRWQYEMLGFTAGMVTLIAVYYAYPDQRMIFVGIGLAGVAGIIRGIIRNRPAHPLPWVLLAAANLTFTAGEAAQIILIQYLHESNPFPSASDAFYLATYPLYAAGLLGFVKWRTARRDRASLIDALTLTVGLALLSWVYVIIPYAHLAELTWIQKAVAIAYPLGDILVLAMLLRLLAPHGGKSVSLALLTAGTIGLLTADVLYALIQLHGTWETGGPVELGWALFYVAWGAAALHPSMVTLTEPVRWRPDTALGRLGLLTLASLIAPGMLIIEAIRGNTKNAGVIGAFSAALFFLVLLRLSGVAATHRQAVRRERILREAVASLGAATSVTGVVEAVRPAVTRLLGDTARHDTVMILPRGDTLVAMPDGGGARPAPPEITGVVRALTDAGDSRLVSSTALGGELAGEPAEAPSVLVCPFALQDHQAGDTALGALNVTGDEQDLLVVQESVQTLAAQAGLAIERIELSREVTKRNSEAYFRTLVQNASDVILILDETDRIRYASPSADQVLGYPNMEQTLLTDLVPPQNSRAVVQSLAQMRQRNDRNRRETWQMVRVDHSTIEAEVRFSDLRQEATVGGLVLTLRDVTEQRALERELTHRAFHDSLTGMANRLLFQDRINHALAQSQREGTVVGVLFVDVDDFKVVNDIHGHAVGDELLVAVSLRLSTTVRASDTAARIGGDEFALLVEDSVTPADVETFADHVMGVFAEPFRLSVGQVSVYASVGIATTDDSFDAVELLAHADLALYEAKTAGKRQWRRYRPALQEGMAERHELQESLDQAPIETSFTVLYQPIVDLASGAAAGFEALVRWPHATRGVVLPEEFISLAEESGRIIPLGAWVLSEAVTETIRMQTLVQADTWATDRHSPYMSVNVSPRQFRDEGFVDRVRQVLDASQLPPSSLVLELTESVLMRHDDRVLADMRAITDLGVRIAIDDFGTGYSSLSYLRDFPISLLKIDKSFIDELGRSPQQYALVEGIVHLADTLGVKVIAEGIENQNQLELLLSMGCPLGQGFLFARPLAADRAESFVLAPNADHLGNWSRSASQ
ncbi:EAL domain-containing protein [Streptomyces kaniharaensis]|uniref:EAL domain-containing protein n=1 Tax=Streptomyces kaniharaensis TaxID=212423 RepID=UPI0018A87FAC|nr:EAL domain-containing protein [Streptomyces kaniharaensis]